MYCLWNGEYGEHDLSYVSGLDSIIENQKNTYGKYVGVVVGDFTCLEVEYDWGKRDQRWKIKCNICGEESYQYHTKDWRRGKGGKLTCDCRKITAHKQKVEENNERLRQRNEKIERVVGKEFFGWKVIDYTGFKNCTVQCTTCGKVRKMQPINQVEENLLFPCNHVVPNDYSDDEWIGKRVGHLTTVEKKGPSFVAVCDCGRKRVVRGTDLFRTGIVRTCGKNGCKYSTEMQIVANERKSNGFKFEEDMELYLQSIGYDAKKTKKVGDYGVDIIINESNGEKTAIQCKTDKGQAGVSSVQEVYAGGRFYGCVNFCVICKSGFSNAAINMANVLGVYLCDGEYNPPKNKEDYCKELLPTYRGKCHRKLYEICGEKHTVEDWCAIYDIPDYVVSKRIEDGLTLETALALPYNKRGNYKAFGLTGTIDAFAKLFNITAPAVSYRMKVKGMTLEEALTAEKTWNKKKNT